MMSSTPGGQGFKLSTGMMAFVVIWALAGLSALLMSIYCAASKQSTGDQNLIGILLAFFLGPFYWLYYYYAKGKGYCT